MVWEAKRRRAAAGAVAAIGLAPAGHSSVVWLAKRRRVAVLVVASHVGQSRIVSLDVWEAMSLRMAAVGHMHAAAHISDGHVCIPLSQTCC